MTWLDQVIPQNQALPGNKMGQNVAVLNQRYQGLGAAEVLSAALSASALDADLGRVAMMSSFGADSVVLLHLLSQHNPHVPIFFIDTQMLFPETLAYQQELAHMFKLTDIRVIRPGAALAQHDPDNTLHQRDPNLCCHLRKVQPLENVFTEFDTWITGRKRYQNTQRQSLEMFELEHDDPSVPARLRFNPMVGWGPLDAAQYIAAHNLPRHPLTQRGYASIGCAPCTSPITEGEDPRAGRWRGQDKTECGIHFVGGKMVRVGQEVSA